LSSASQLPKAVLVAHEREPRVLERQPGERDLAAQEQPEVDVRQHGLGLGEPAPRPGSGTTVAARVADHDALEPDRRLRHEREARALQRDRRVERVRQPVAHDRGQALRGKDEREREHRDPDEQHQPAERSEQQRATRLLQAASPLV
jgi:hypothetical protein